jgi:MATE family multidrug resistance protein
VAALPARLNWQAVLRADRLLRTFQVNLDIFLRTLCLVIAFSLFTAKGAEAGDAILAANAVLMQLLHVATYALDGFASAAEALVGSAVGRRDRAGARQAVRLVGLWGLIAACGFSLLLALGGWLAVHLFTGVAEVRQAAADFLPWLIVLPPLGVWAYLFDGVFAGATRSADMRNTMALALGAYLAVLYGLSGGLGNHGLWLALAIFLAVRGLGLAARYPALLRAIAPPTS